MKRGLAKSESGDSGRIAVTELVESSCGDEGSWDRPEAVVPTKVISPIAATASARFARNPIRIYTPQSIEFARTTVRRVNAIRESSFACFSLSHGLRLPGYHFGHMTRLQLVTILWRPTDRDDAGANGNPAKGAHGGGSVAM